MAQIHCGVKTSRKQGGPKMGKIQNGAKPDIFKHAARCTPVPAVLSVMRDRVVIWTLESEQINFRRLKV